MTTAPRRRLVKKISRVDQKRLDMGLPSWSESPQSDTNKETDNDRRLLEERPPHWREPDF